MTEYIIVSEEDGVFIGEMLGLGFWSKLDPVGIKEAVTFPSEGSIGKYLSTWAEYPKENLSFIEISVLDSGKATMEECVSVGVDAWDVEPIDCESDGELDVE